MRNKVVIIKGNCNIGIEITLAEFERLNADYVVAICALKKPQMLPLEFGMNIEKVLTNTKELLQYWKDTDQYHNLLSEYASIVIEKGRDNIRVVEGDCLTISWFYDAVKAMHKNFGQIIVDVELKTNSTGIFIEIDGIKMDRDQFIQHLQPNQILG